jgi:hypothetical protein
MNETQSGRPNPNQDFTTKNPNQDFTTKARDLGRDLKNQASDAAESAVDTVKRQASDLTDSARELASGAAEKMKSAVSDQKTAGADFVSNVAETVRRASYEFDGQMPQAGHYIRKAAAQIDSVSEALRSRDLSELAQDVQDFARKQPAAFFGAAVLAGFAAVRFFKSVPEGQSSQQSGSSNGDGTQRYGSPGRSPSQQYQPYRENTPGR